MINNSMQIGFKGLVGNKKTTELQDASALANIKVLALGAMQNKEDCFVTKNADKSQVTLTPKVLRNDTILASFNNLIKAVFNKPGIEPVHPVSLSVKGDEVKATIYSGAGDSLTYTVKDQQQASDLKGMIHAAEKKF